MLVFWVISTNFHTTVVLGIGYFLITFQSSLSSWYRFSTRLIFGWYGANNYIPDIDTGIWNRYKSGITTCPLSLPVLGGSPEIWIILADLGNTGWFWFYIPYPDLYSNTWTRTFPWDPPHLRIRVQPQNLMTINSTIFLTPCTSVMKRNRDTTLPNYTTK